MTDDLPPDPQVVAGIDALGPEHGRLFISIGVFDGLHLGHLYLLRHLSAAAASRAARPAVITFDHHPDEILVGAAPPLLCDPGERLALLARAGVEVIVVQHFDRVLQQTAYDDFIRRIAARVDLAGFLMTPDAAFGHDRQGTPATVAALGASLGFEVAVVPPMSIDGRQVRSTEIRSAIAVGRLSDAAVLLGRPYAVIGTQLADPSGQRTIVVFPTPVALPPPGDYSGLVSVRATGSGSAPVTVRLNVLADHTLQVPDGLALSAGAQVRVTFV